MEHDKISAMKNITSILLILVILTGMVVATTACQPSSIKLTVLHTNDTRAHLDSIPRRATAISQIRNEVGVNNTLLLDAGDVFGGTPYYNMYKGQADLWFMQQLGYDAMCTGNHEFDDGVKYLADFVRDAQFPILCANFDFANESNLVKKPLPWTIIKKDGQQYGVFGLTTEETAEISVPGKNIIINDHIAAAQKAVSDLNKKGINKIIAITHLGWQKDLELARMVEGIDIIVGGHTGTVPETYPTVVTTHGAPTLVVQAGELGKYLGRLDVVFDGHGVLQSWQGQLITIDDKIQENVEFANKLAEYREPVKTLLNTVIGKTRVTLEGERNIIRSKETNLGNMVTDAMLAKASASGATMAMVNSGVIRVSVPVGDITLGKVMEVSPFENYVVVVDVTEELFVAALENGVSTVETLGGRFPQVSGLRFTWDPGKKPGSRIVSVEIKTQSGYKPIDTSAKYRVAISNFMYQGGDGYTVFQNGSNYTNIGFIDYEVLIDYIMVNSPVNPQTEGRIIRQTSP